MSIQIIYSPFADTIKKQLKKQGLKFDKNEVKLIQEISFSVMNLKFHEIINESEADKFHAKIHDRLLKHLDEHNAV